MKYLKYILPLIILCASSAFGASWTISQTNANDSIDMTYVQKTNPEDNCGLCTGAHILGANGADSFSLLVRPTYDPRVAGYQDDSAYVYIYNDGTAWNVGNDDEDTSWLLVSCLILDWEEGNNASMTPAGLNEVSWDSNLTQVSAWNADGAQALDLDIARLPIDSVRLAGLQNLTDTVEIRVASGWYDTLVSTNAAQGVMKIKIPGRYMNAFFKYGVLIHHDSSVGGGNSASRWASDNNTTQSRRPWMEGWQTPFTGWTAGQTADSVDGTTMTYTDNDRNWGAYDSLMASRVASDTAHILIRPTNVRWNKSRMQEYALLILTFAGGEPNAAGDSVIIHPATIDPDWPEGSGTTSTDSLDVSWIYRDNQVGSADTAWESGGAGDTSGTLDRVVMSSNRDSIRLGGAVAPGTPCTLTVSSLWLSKVVYSGLILDVTRTTGTISNYTFFYSDDSDVEPYRPKFVFFETVADTLVGDSVPGGTEVTGPALGNVTTIVSDSAGLKYTAGPNDTLIGFWADMCHTVGGLDPGKCSTFFALYTENNDSAYNLLSGSPTVTWLPRREANGSPYGTNFVPSKRISIPLVQGTSYIVATGQASCGNTPVFSVDDNNVVPSDEIQTSSTFLSTFSHNSFDDDQWTFYALIKQEAAEGGGAPTNLEEGKILEGVLIGQKDIEDTLPGYTAFMKERSNRAKTLTN